jgi:hypothetical protein
VRWDHKVRHRLLARPLSPYFYHASTPDHHEGTVVHPHRALPHALACYARVPRCLRRPLRAARTRGEAAACCTTTAHLPRPPDDLVKRGQEQTNSSSLVWSKRTRGTSPRDAGKPREVAPDLAGVQPGRSHRLGTLPATSRRSRPVARPTNLAGRPSRDVQLAQNRLSRLPHCGGQTSSAHIASVPPETVTGQPPDRGSSRNNRYPDVRCCLSTTIQKSRVCAGRSSSPSRIGIE